MLNKFKCLVSVSLLLVCLPGALLHAQSLKGSKTVMARQNQIAVNYGYSFLKTPQQVRSFYENGYLVKVTDSSTMTIHNVSYPYARAEVKLFLERLSQQYQNACGEKLVVTSLTRPLDKQPGNASDDSVHPTGMAVDLRIPSKSRCRSWLQSTLLSLEKSDVLDVTRERYPPHFHVALFTKSYAEYVAAMQNKQPELVAVTRDYTDGYTVRRGDSLYLIAQRTDTTIEGLRAANNLRGNLLKPGQVLIIPGTPALSPLSVGPTRAQVATASVDAPEPSPAMPVTMKPAVAKVDKVPEVEKPAPAFVGPTLDQLVDAPTLTLLADAIEKAVVQETAAPAVQEIDEQTMPASNRNYTVRRGDSLYLIAERNDTTVEALRAANNLRSIMLQPGQVLTIPADPESLLATTSAPALTHRVRRGDSLWEIATMYRTSISSLVAMNGLSGDTLQVGQVLKVSGN